MTAVDLKALRDEALAGDPGGEFQQGIPMTFDGIGFRVPPLALWPLKVMKAARTVGPDAALELLLGPGTADQLLDAGFVMDDFERLVQKASPPGTAPPTVRSSASGS